MKKAEVKEKEIDVPLTFDDQSNIRKQIFDLQKTLLDINQDINNLTEKLVKGTKKQVCKVVEEIDDEYGAVNTYLNGILISQTKLQTQPIQESSKEQAPPIHKQVSPNIPSDEDETLVPF